MPLYQFQHPEKGDMVEVFFNMNDEKEFIDEEGVEWKRVFSNINFGGLSAKSFNENATMFDKKGRPLKVHKITNADAKAKGFDNVTDYIDYSNSLCDPEKSPEAVEQRRHDQARDKGLMEKAEYQQRQQSKAAEKRRKATRRGATQVQGPSFTVSNKGKVKD
jgi:hypothetical protein